VSGLLAVAAFLAGVVIVVWSTELLLDSMVRLVTLLRAAPFVVAGVFSGLEAENVAVGVVAGHAHHANIALGTVFGGGSFVVSVALGLGAVLFPLRVRVPAGWRGLCGWPRSRRACGTWLGASRRHDFLGGEATEIREEAGKLVEDTRRSWWRPVGLTVFGLGVITVGAELVNYGADSIVRRFAFPAALMGMVVTPAAIEAEEVIRQAVPSRHGRHDVAAGKPDRYRAVLRAVQPRPDRRGRTRPGTAKGHHPGLAVPDRRHLAGHHPVARSGHPLAGCRVADRLRRDHPRPNCQLAGRGRRRTVSEVEIFRDDGSKVTMSG
jgi:hypothetical protein